MTCYTRNVFGSSIPHFRIQDIKNASCEKARPQDGIERIKVGYAEEVLSIRTELYIKQDKWKH